MTFSGALTTLFVLIFLQVPQQTNGWDCGVYLVHFAKVFMRHSNIFVCSPSVKPVLVITVYLCSTVSTFQPNTLDSIDWCGAQALTLRTELRDTLDRLASSVS